MRTNRRAILKYLHGPVKILYFLAPKGNKAAMTLINYHTFGDRAGSFGLAPKKRGLNGSLSSSEGEETTPSGGRRRRPLQE
jgi:hypothetical protein